MSTLSILRGKEYKPHYQTLRDHYQTKFHPISIAEANKVMTILNDSLTRKGSYIKVTPERKAQIARYAMEHGNCAASRKYSKEPQQHLNESTVHSWVKTYRVEWQKTR